VRCHKVRGTAKPMFIMDQPSSPAGELILYNPDRKVLRPTSEGVCSTGSEYRIRSSAAKR
jgi:hypothetical protein